MKSVLGAALEVQDFLVSHGERFRLIDGIALRGTPGDLYQLPKLKNRIEQADRAP
ncbi:MAG: hypothetical protein HY017_01395 [Betaproteobacteria bacterium]|nr:hypothetical protein [Betaproteobacteria bacterium]